MELAKAVIRMGPQPAVWKRASGVVSCKPGKHDCTKHKVYRCIALLSSMGKVVEKVVAGLLAEEAERRGLLSDDQCGRRTRWSAIDMVTIMVDRAHTSWRQSPIAGVLLMDIKAAFPSVRRG